MGGWGRGVHAPEMVESVGFVQQHDKVGISISKGRAADGAVLTWEFIPAGMITKVKVLKDD